MDMAHPFSVCAPIAMGIFTKYVCVKYVHNDENIKTAYEVP